MATTMINVLESVFQFFTLVLHLIFYILSIGIFQNTRKKGVFCTVLNMRRYKLQIIKCYFCLPVFSSLPDSFCIKKNKKHK